jgi:predicted metal-dependent phosphoesterase TrpH
MKLDLHIHTRRSPDSLNPPAEIARRCAKLGILPAITDHNSTAAHAEFRALGIKFIPGEEIRTKDGEIIALFINEAIPAKLDFSETMDRVHEAGALAYLPHMYDAARHGQNNDKLASKADAIEVINARCAFSWQNEKALEFAERHKLLKGAGSDAHFVREVGNAYVECPEMEIDSPKALISALKKGKPVQSGSGLGFRGFTTAVKHAKKLFRL